MKQKDIALIIVIAFIGAIVSLLLSNKIFAAPSKRQQNIEIVETISSSFSQPDSRYFNKESVNPTKIITLEKNDNKTPFSGSASTEQP